MNSKERVFTALDHKEPDRVPLDLGAIMESTMHLRSYRVLKEHLNINRDKEIPVKLLTAQFTDIEPEVQKAVKADVRGVQPNPSQAHKIILKDEGEYIQFQDEFGLSWRMPKDNGLYYDIFEFPMASFSREDIENYPFPNPREESRFTGLSEKIEALAEEGTYPVVFDNCFGNGIFQMCNHLMGYDKFLVSLALEESKADYLMDKILEMKLEFWDEVLTRFGSKIDIVKDLDDMGTQKNLLISPEMYRKNIFPRLKKLITFIKKKAPHVCFMTHSCGSIRKIIPDLIEAGVEILNPVQYSSDDMDPAALKKEFGKDITFWGGGIDTQKILPHGTPQDVRNETKKILDIMMPGGGFVFTQVHAIQWDVPLENMMAMWETVWEHGKYW